MLNRKLHKHAVFTIGLLFSFMVSFAGVQQPGDTSLQVRKDSAMLLTFDPASLMLSGFNDENMPTAPAITLNKQASIYVQDYVKRNEKLLQKIKAKSVSPFATMDAIFTRYDLPVELKYLAVIESQLKTTALSRVGARGAWQLMPATARNYKLKITSTYDERTHLYKSTVAAAKYLDYLHGLFDDWLLVIAAYNAGPGTIYKAIKKSGSRNFWKLQQFLPAETRSHVKKYIGTHYFFEGEGSITTLTKEEVALYSKKMMAFVEEQNSLLAVRTTPKPAAETIVDQQTSNGTTEQKTTALGEMRLDEEE